MKILKKLLSSLIICAVIITNSFTVSAETIKIEESEEISLANTGFLVATSDKYIFSVEGSKRTTTTTLRVYDKETLAPLTDIIHLSSGKYAMRPFDIHVKGDYLYVTYTYAGNGGSPVAIKYDISSIYEDMEITSVKSKGINKTGISCINDNVICTVNMNYKYLGFDNTETVSSKSAIKISSENESRAESYENLYLENNVLYAKVGKNLHIYDATDALLSKSKQDTEVYEGYITFGESILDVAGYGNYIYVSTSAGVYIYDMTSPESPVLINTVTDAAGANDIEINGDNMYLATSAEFKIYSLADPESPLSVSSYAYGSTVYDVHLRPGKVYLTGPGKIAVLNVEGIEIEETTVLGSDAKDVKIEYVEKINETTSDFCADEDYLCILNNDNNVVNILDAATKELKASVYKEENSAKLNINNIELINGELYVSYDGYLRKYMLSRLDEGKELIEQAAMFMYTESLCDYASIVATSDSYIFVAGADNDRASLANGKIYIFDKTTGNYIDSIIVDTGNANYDVPVRNMYTLGDNLYVTYNVAKTDASYTGGTLAAVSPLDGNTRHYAPIYEYDFSDMAESGTYTLSEVVCSNADLKNLSHPYNRGGNSWADIENNIIYQGKYTTSTGQNYVAYNISEEKVSKVFTVTNGSYDCVKFIVSGNILCEILRNNGGLSKTGVVTQEYNKVNFYDISRTTETTIDLSESGRLLGTYQTSLYGTSTITDVVINEGFAYIGTSSGVKVINLETYEEVSSVLDGTRIYEMITEDNNLFVSAYSGVYILSLSESPSVLAQYESSVPLYDIEVDTENSIIYSTWRKAEGFGAVFSYDETSIDFERYLTLETSKSNNAEISEDYTFSLNEDDSSVSVYNTQTKLKKTTITEFDKDILPEIIMQGSVFYSYASNTLTQYYVPSSSSVLADLQKGTFTADSSISCVCADDDNIYLATEQGVLVVDAETLEIEVTLYSGTNVSSLTLSGNYLYGMTQNGELFVAETQKYTTLATNSFEITSPAENMIVSENNIYCHNENGEISVYEVSGEFVVTYDIDVAEPENKTVRTMQREQGFPYIDFEKREFSAHSLVCATEDYVATAGSGDIKIYDRDLNEIKTIDTTNVVTLCKKDNSIIYADKSGSYGVYLVNLEDNESESIKISEAASGICCADENSIYVLNSTDSQIEIYSFDGTLLKTITEVPTGISKIYAKDNLLYAVLDAKTDFYIYNLSSLENEDTALAADVFVTSYSFGDTYPAISSMEESDGYLYVSTAWKSVASVNGLYYWDISAIKSGESTELGSRSRYKSVSTGGQVTDFVIRGDYIIADCIDASAIQVINIQDKTNPYRESMIRKGTYDNHEFTDLDESNGKVYAVSSSGGVCAYNYTAIDIADMTFVSGETETYAPSGDKVKAKVKIYNESGKQSEAKLFLAVYEGNLLSNVTTIDVCAPNGGETIVTTDELTIDTSQTTLLKAMLIKDMDSLVPLCESQRTFEPVADNIIYVDVNATEGGNGSQETPFKTIEEAKEYVKSINKAMASDITVEIAGGRYELSEPLVFDEEDSGFNGFKVIYKAKEGETPIIAGGRKIENWTLYDSEKGIYAAPANGIRTRQLVVDGERAVRARSEGRLTSATCDGGDLGIYCYNEELLDYKNIKDLELVFNSTFVAKRAMVDSVHRADSNGKVLIVVNNPFWNITTGFDNYVAPSYYENALELLDEENEFYLDMEADMVYYKPKTDVIDINVSEIYAPVLEELFVFKGSSIYNRVKNIEISGLTFTETTWMMPTDNGGFNTTQAGYCSSPVSSDGNPVAKAINLERAEGITISSCEMKNLGAIAVGILTSVSNVKIENNVIKDISAGGIHIGEIKDSHANPFDTRKCVEDIIVSNNLITNIGREYYTFCAVNIATSQNVEVSHNEISHTPYSGIHIGWGWDSLPKHNIVGLKVEYNHIHDVIEVLCDAGAIYHTGYTLADCDLNPNYIRYNHIEKIHQGGLYAGSGIYLDTGSSGYEVSSNVIDLTQCSGSWIPKWGTGREGNVFDSNYTTTVNGYSGATNTKVFEDAEWDDEALAIIENAGRK